MPKKIFKYQLDVIDEQTLWLPVGSEILCVQTQDGGPCLWAIVDTDVGDAEDHLLRIYGTGHPMAENMVFEHKYIDTFQMEDGMLVFHVFELVYRPLHS